MILCYHITVCTIVLYLLHYITIQLIFGIPIFIQATQPGHPSVDRCNEYWRWFRPSMGRNGASEVTTLWHFINQLIK